MLRIALGIILSLLLLGTAQAQAPEHICIASFNTTTGALNCVDVSATNPFPVIAGASSASGNGITPVVSAAAEASHVLKATAGNLYSVYVSNPSASGYLMTFNSATVPIDGAVTPIDCIPVSASSLGFINYIPGPPGVFSTGISVAFSSTGCFTKTTSPTAFFHGVVQ